MTDLEELRERLRNHRPVPWGQLPDFALYMDQVLGYMDRQIIRFRDDDPLTSAMVNNYTKSGLVPRAEGKKYGREHLAYLTAICVLKRVMSTRDMDLLIRQELRGRKSVEDGYGAFCESLDKALRITLREVEQREGLSVDADPAGNEAPGTAILGTAKPGTAKPETAIPGTAGELSGTEEAESGSMPGTAEAEPDRLPEAETAENKPGMSARGEPPAGVELSAGEADGERGAAGYSLADNAIHFALLSYAAGIASRRYVALLRKQHLQLEGAQSAGKAVHREARFAEKTARREARETAKAAKREARPPEKAAKHEARPPEKAAKREARPPEKAAKREARPPEKAAKREARPPEKAVKHGASLPDKKADALGQTGTQKAGDRDGTALRDGEITEPENRGNL